MIPLVNQIFEATSSETLWTMHEVVSALVSRILRWYVLAAQLG